MSKFKTIFILLPILITYIFISPIVTAQTFQENSTTTFLELNTSQDWDLNIEGLGDGDNEMLENFTTTNITTQPQTTDGSIKHSNVSSEYSWLAKIGLFSFFILLLFVLFYIWKVNVKKIKSGDLTNNA